MTKIKSLTTTRTNNTSLGEFVRIWLRGGIQKGAYTPSNLIIASEIAARLRVSPNRVRGSFSRPQADGLLVITPWAAPKWRNWAATKW